MKIEFEKIVDPVARTGFQPGEEVRVHDCETVYHGSTYRWLVENNASCQCGRQGTWQRTRVPERGRARPAPEPKPERRGAPPPGSIVWKDRRERVPGGTPAARHLNREVRLEDRRDGVPRVTPETARAHFGREVQLEGTVAKVHFSEKSGTTFIQFEEGYRFNSLKAVIFKTYRERFERSGWRFETLAGQRIAVRWWLENHRRWGPQIVLREPARLELRRA